MKRNKFVLGGWVSRDGVECEVIDLRVKDGGWVYDLRELDGDGELNDVPEGLLAGLH